MKELIYKNNIFEIKQKTESYEEIVCRKINKLIGQLKAFKMTHNEFKSQIDEAIEHLENVKTEDIVSCRFDELFAFTVVIDSPNKTFFIQKDFIAEKRLSARYYSNENEYALCQDNQEIERSENCDEQMSILQ